MLDAVAAHYEVLEGAGHPPAPMPAEAQLADFEVFLPLIDCRTATPTAPAAITFMPCVSEQQAEGYSISLYAADPLLTTFSYIGGRKVQLLAEQQAQVLLLLLLLLVVVVVQVVL
jgi:hypothetical protein